MTNRSREAVAKINLVHIPYKSTALAIYAATSGEVTIAFGGTPEDFGRLIRAEMEKWGKIIRDAGIKGQ